MVQSSLPKTTEERQAKIEAEKTVSLIIAKAMIERHKRSFEMDDCATCDARIIVVPTQWAYRPSDIDPDDPWYGAVVVGNFKFTPNDKWEAEVDLKRVSDGLLWHSVTINLDDLKPRNEMSWWLHIQPNAVECSGVNRKSRCPRCKSHHIHYSQDSYSDRAWCSECDYERVFMIGD